MHESSWSFSAIPFLTGMTRRSFRLPLFRLFMLGCYAVSQDHVAALLLKHAHSCGADWWLPFKMVWISGRHWIGQMLCFHTWRILGGGDYFGVVLKHSPLAQPEASMTWSWPSHYFGSDLGGAHSFRGRATAASTGLHAELASVGKERLSLCLLVFFFMFCLRLLSTWDLLNWTSLDAASANAL